jgi:hypothetical protein
MLDGAAAGATTGGVVAGATTDKGRPGSERTGCKIGAAPAGERREPWRRSPRLSFCASGDALRRPPAKGAARSRAGRPRLARAPYGVAQVCVLVNAP